MCSFILASSTSRNAPRKRSIFACRWMESINETRQARGKKLPHFCIKQTSELRIFPVQRLCQNTFRHRLLWTQLWDIFEVIVRIQDSIVHKVHTCEQLIRNHDDLARSSENEISFTSNRRNTLQLDEYPHYSVLLWIVRHL